MTKQNTLNEDKSFLLFNNSHAFYDKKTPLNEDKSLFINY